MGSDHRQMLTTHIKISIHEHMLCDQEVEIEPIILSVISLKPRVIL